jgi:hypothetical protein
MAMPYRRDPADDEALARYREKRPGTGLTDEEILAELEGEMDCVADVPKTTKDRLAAGHEEADRPPGQRGPSPERPYRGGR